MHQQDVQSVLNALWAGGAEAVGMQDQRIISTSAPRCIGNTLLLHGRTYSPPYVMSAIGDVARLEAALAAEPGIRIYKQYATASASGTRRQRRRRSRSPPIPADSTGVYPALMRILVVDNYDSFVFNLVQYLGQLGTEAVVWRNDDPQLTADLEGAVAQFDGILLSPGPGTPQRAGATMDLVKVCADTKTPLLGVCLGHQAIGAAFGGTVDRAPELLHGKTSLVHHKDVGVLAGLPDPFTATATTR